MTETATYNLKKIKKDLSELQRECDEKYERFQKAVEKALDKVVLEEQDFAELETLAGEAMESVEFWEGFAHMSLELAQIPEARD